MSEWTHPRRATKETITYLLQIEPVLDEFDEDAPGYEDEGGAGNNSDENEGVGRKDMLDNVLEELKFQTASIMEDRKGSVVAEKIARRLTPLQLRVVLSRCRGYMRSLANNRYSSHVLQTLLSFAGRIIQTEVLECSTDGEEFVIDTQGNHGDKVDLLQSIVLSLASELAGTWAELIADISGSHVGRAFLQVLGGLPILKEARGKQSRHAHSIDGAVGPDAAMRMKSSGASVSGARVSESDNPMSPPVDPGALDRWSTPHKYRVPSSFEVALRDTTSELESLPAGELQSLACGTFGCPLMVMLLRVYGNLAVDPSSGRLPTLQHDSPALSLVRKVLQWDDETRSTEVVYAMSGENSASHFLEAVIWLSPLGFFQEIYRKCFESRLLEYCEHAVSNFLIQAALQRVDDKALAEDMVMSVGDHAPVLLANGRAGVMWRAAQTCSRLNLKSEIQAKFLDAVAGAALLGDGSDRGSGDAAGGSARSKSSQSDPFRAAREWVPTLLKPRLPGEGTSERLSLNVPGARIVQNVISFEPAVAAPVLKAVAALPENLLAAVARDNLGSRCLIDPVLDAARESSSGGKKSKAAEDARRAMLRAFKGNLVRMACDRVAWHILIKCFRDVDMKEKRVIVEELAGEQTMSRMLAYPSGRSVSTECMVERFSRSPQEWEAAFKKRNNHAKLLDEILAVDKKQQSENKAGARTRTNESIDVSHGRPRDVAPSRAGASSDAEGGDNEDEGDAPSNQNDVNRPKEKRRRQRGRGKRGKTSASAMSGAEVARENDSISRDEAPDAADGTKPQLQKESDSKRSAGGGDRQAKGETSTHAEEPIAETNPKKKSKKSKMTAEDSNETEGRDRTPASLPQREEAEARTSPASKKKRKRQHSAEGKAEQYQGAKNSAKVNEAADLSFVIDAIKKSATSSNGQQESNGKGTKSGQSKKKSKRRGDVGEHERECIEDHQGDAPAVRRSSKSRGESQATSVGTKKASGGSKKLGRSSSSSEGGFRLF